MRLAPQPQDDPCFQRFRSKLHEFTVRPKSRDDWEARSFVLIDKLEKWLKSKADTSSGLNGAILLEAVYTKRDVQPINYVQMVEGELKCLLTFCILLELRQGDLLYAFSRSGRIVDKLLPMDLYSLGLKVEECINSQHISYAPHESAQLAREFDKLQWKYFAVVFGLGHRRDWEPFRILPFVDRQLITDKGGTANVYEVAVPECFVDRSLRIAAGASMRPHPKFEDLGPVPHSLTPHLQLLTSS